MKKSSRFMVKQAFHLLLDGMAMGDDLLCLVIGSKALCSLFRILVRDIQDKRWKIAFEGENALGFSSIFMPFLCLR